MTETHPTRDWDYLAMSNIVPPPTLSTEITSCVLCQRPLRVDFSGGLYTMNCGAVCDDCGNQQAPDLMVLVHQLRACADLTLTVGGARIDADDEAWTCPLCGHDLDDDPPPGWHLVDAAYGRPVCAKCAPTLPTTLRDLLAALLLHEQQIDAWAIHDATAC